MRGPRGSDYSTRERRRSSRASKTSSRLSWISSHVPSLASLLRTTGISSNTSRVSQSTRSSTCTHDTETRPPPTQVRPGRKDVRLDDSGLLFSGPLPEGTTITIRIKWSDDAKGPLSKCEGRIYLNWSTNSDNHYSWTMWYDYHYDSDEMPNRQLPLDIVKQLLEKKVKTTVQSVRLCSAIFSAMNKCNFKRDLEKSKETYKTSAWIRIRREGGWKAV
jgi:hypothetical protein